MAQVDVTEVLLDPDMIDKMVLIHRHPWVDDFGEQQLTEQGFPTVGTVYPASGKILERIPEALRDKDVRSFLLKGKIICDSKDRYPDLISLKGIRYTVLTVFDFTNYGAGFCEGVCVREDMAL